MGRKPGTGRWTKGQSGNLSGKPKQDPMVAKFKATTYKDFMEHLQRYGAFTRKEMDVVLKNEATSMFELIFATIVSQAANGCKHARQVLLDRLWGKVKEIQEITIENNGLEDKIKMLSPLKQEQLIELLREAKNASESR